MHRHVLRINKLNIHLQKCIDTKYTAVYVNEVYVNEVLSAKRKHPYIIKAL